MSSSQNTIIQIIEAYREGGKPKQHVLRHIGTAKTEVDVQKLMEIAEAIKIQLTQQALAESINNVSGEYAKSAGRVHALRKGMLIGVQWKN